MQKEVHKCNQILHFQFMHYILDSFNKYIRSWKLWLYLWMMKYCKPGSLTGFGFVLAQFVFSQSSVIRFCHVDLRRADGDLVKKLFVLQHALKHKDDEREWRKLSNGLSSVVQEQVSVSPSDCWSPQKTLLSVEQSLQSLPSAKHRTHRGTGDRRIRYKMLQSQAKTTIPDVLWTPVVWTELNWSTWIFVPVPGGQSVPHRSGRPSGSCCFWAFPRSWGRCTPRHHPDVSSSKCRNHRMTGVSAGRGKRRQLAVGWSGFLLMGEATDNQYFSTELK